MRIMIRGARRYWWLVLMLWLVLSASIGVGIYLYVKPSYRALSLLRVDPAVTDLYDVGRARNESLDPFLQTQVQLITSPNVLTAAGTNPKAAVLERIQKAGDVVQELRKVVNVSVIPGTYLIEVAMTSPNSYEAATLVNAVVDSFMEANNEWSDGMTRVQIRNLEAYNAELKNQTDELERKLKALAAKSDVDVISGERKKEDGGTAKTNDLGPIRSITMQEYREVYKQLNDIKYELVQAEARLTEAKAAASHMGKAAGTTDEKAMIEEQIKRRFQVDPEAAELRNKLTDADLELKKNLRISTLSSDPALKAAQRKVETLKAKWEQLWDIKSAAIREQIELAGGIRGLDPALEVHEAAKQVNMLKAKQASLKQDFDRLDVKGKGQAVDAVDIALIHYEHDTLKGLQESVTKRLEQLKYEAKGEARIRPVNPNGAMVPGKPISDKRLTFLAATPVGVLGAVLGLIVLLELRSGRVDDPEVLSSRIKHEVFSIAPLPSLRPGDDVTSEKAEQRLARFVQSLDHLRVAICEGGHAGEGRCVMITSATGGEGKTTLSAHLAARCANSGTSTLLVDADMRRASLGRLLDVPVGPGLGDVLGGEIDLDDALITVQAGGFHFLSAGSPGRDPSRVLKSNRFSELIARLRTSYDLVIIDTPPVLPVADALIMGRWVDGAVMAARFDASRLPLVERANRQLAMAGIPVLGVVVNGVRGQDATYGNYAYSYNYYPTRREPSADSPTS
jgi:capsular exopolysaccharide synthesis family protein